MKALVTIAAIVAGSSAALAADLDLRAQSGGSSMVAVQPGATVSYDVIGELSDAQSQGLAMFTFDLQFDGGPLSQAAAPLDGTTMDSFSPPEGLSNPAGYGGTALAGGLLQVGGAQNTINNQFAPKPMGDVTLGVALKGSPEVLVSGSLVAPTQPGSYTLSIVDPLANVIRPTADGVPFWEVTAAGAGAIENLIVIVVDCTSPTVYCTAKVNSQGCTPAIAFSGTPGLSGADDFHVTASEVINSQFGTLFWSLTPDAAPFMGGIRCADHPIVRTPNQMSGGSPPGTTDCSGTFDFHFSQAYMQTVGLTGGQTVYAQYWYRDPMQPDGTGVGLSDAVEFVVCP